MSNALQSATAGGCARRAKTSHAGSRTRRHKASRLRDAHTLWAEPLNGCTADVKG